MISVCGQCWEFGGFGQCAGPPGLHSASMWLLPCSVAPTDPSLLRMGAGCYGNRGQDWAEPARSLSNTAHSGRELFPRCGAGRTPSPHLG